jgi:leucyl aminopeptidase
VLVEATTGSALATEADTVAVGHFEDDPVPEVFGGTPVESLIRSGEASPKFGRLALSHDGARRFVLVGLGDRRGFGTEPARRAAAHVHRRADEVSASVLCWSVPPPADAEITRALIEGTLLHAYRFDRYKPRRDRPALARLIVATPDDASDLARETAIVVAAQNRARDLGNTPGNDLPPSALAEYAARVAESREGLTLSTLDGAAIRELGMGAFAAVAQGSVQSARLIHLEYEGPGCDLSAPRLALIGKGVTFDSGGLSLKSGATMHEMKFDMGGGAAVVEALAAVAELRVPVRILGVVGATENLPSGSAVKPGDIVRALDGTTIEVNNTDAEGRLVLADCLCYARQQGCDRIVDVATLTGAVVVALGSTYAGIMANDEAWADQITTAARRAGEPVWRLPLHPDYAEMVKGRYAQLTNRSERREAMALTAAELLHPFAGDLPWAHLDIAGTAWDVPRPYFVGKGATGFGVRLFVELARTLASN